MEQRSVLFHGLVKSEHRLQDFIINLDQLQGLLCDVWAGGRNGGHGMSLVEGLAGGHDILRHEACVALNLGQVNHLIGYDGEVLGRDHRGDTGQGLSLGGVDGPDSGVCVGAAQHLAVQHARELDVGAILRCPDDFVHAVVPDGPGSHNVVLTGFLGLPDGLLATGGRRHYFSNTGGRGPG